VSDLTPTGSTLNALEYAPAPESASLVRFAASYGLFLDGAFTDPGSHQQFETLNPAMSSRRPPSPKRRPPTSRAR
jgi:hypothetical protein